MGNRDGASRVTERLTERDLGRAAELLRSGQTVAFATETVYGLGADARNGEAVARIYEAKGRPTFNPLIVHVADTADVERYVVMNQTARRLAEAFWPGPMTLILPRRREGGLSDLVSAGLPTVAVRVPAHAGARKLLRAFGGPVAAPSANLSGRVSATTADHVLDGLDGRIGAVVDMGACDVGLESTILLVEGDQVKLARAGGLPVEAVERCLGYPIARDTAPETVVSPGQLLAHYAPVSALRLNATEAGPDEILIGFGPGEAAFNLSPAGDLREAAANLFAMLRAADARAAGRRLAVAPVPNHGLGLAINDRLSRAAAGSGAAQIGG